jgi:hypothetical protein
VTDIGPKEAAQALNDIEQIVQRVRQSRIYDLASQLVIAGGVLVLAGNIANYLAPRHGTIIWIIVNILTVASAAALATVGVSKQLGAQRFDFRVIVGYLLFYGFGIFCCNVLGHFFHAVQLLGRPVVRPRFLRHWDVDHRADAGRLFLHRRRCVSAVDGCGQWWWADPQRALDAQDLIHGRTR